MRRRTLLLLGASAPVDLFTSRYLSARQQRVTSPADYRREAEQLYRLAAEINTPADARNLVDFIAKMFSEQLPPAWTTTSLRNWIAEAEFSSVSDSQKRIPEPRLVAAWNTYMDTLQAPAERKVSPAEIHNLRDGFLASGRNGWERGIRTTWSVPTIYATMPDGTLAPGCRAIESIRILWDLANMPDNLIAARDRVSKGVLVSDLIRAQQSQPALSSGERGSLSVRVSNNPVETAERAFARNNGVQAFSNAVIAMLQATLA